MLRLLESSKALGDRDAELLGPNAPVRALRGPRAVGGPQLSCADAEVWPEGAALCEKQLDVSRVVAVGGHGFGDLWRHPEPLAAPSLQPSERPVKHSRQLS